MDDELLTQIFKVKLMSPPCQNQGYILDGYPKTSEQAQNLFGGKIKTFDRFLLIILVLFYFSIW